MLMRPPGTCATATGPADSGASPARAVATCDMPMRAVEMCDAPMRAVEMCGATVRAVGVSGAARQALSRGATTVRAVAAVPGWGALSRRRLLLVVPRWLGRLAPALPLALLVSPSATDAAAAQAGAAGDAGAAADRVLALTNAERAAAGLGPLAPSPELTAAAQAYAEVLSQGGCFEHTCGPLPELADRLGQAGYVGWQRIGENIAAGYQTPEAVIAAWLASPGHRANLLSADYTEMGVGTISVDAGYGTYWAADFGTRASPPD